MSAVVKNPAAMLKREQERAKREALEAAMWLAIRAHKLDHLCVRQYRFHGEREWRFDFAFPARKVAIEVDGGVFTGGRHTRGAGFTEDIVKLNAAVIDGWRVLRATSAHVKSGEAIGWLESLLLPRRPTVLAGLDDVEPGELEFAKAKPVRSPTYLASVRELPCAHCGRVGASEAAHINFGKAKGMKAPDNWTMPLCRVLAPTPGAPGCHYRYDNYELGNKFDSFEMGKVWATQTYDTIKKKGRVPMNVPRPRFA